MGMYVHTYICIFALDTCMSERVPAGFNDTWWKKQRRERIACITRVDTHVALDLRAYVDRSRSLIVRCSAISAADEYFYIQRITEFRVNAAPFRLYGEATNRKEIDHVASGHGRIQVSSLFWLGRARETHPKLTVKSYKHVRTDTYKTLVYVTPHAECTLYSVHCTLHVRTATQHSGVYT